ncbi:MAG: DUF4013 domain-containing protein [archaeon]
MVDYNAALKKPFLDVKNLIIGILLSILPIINWFAMGYILECTGLTKRKVSLDRSPDWTGWGSLFAKGFFSFVIGLVYMIPALIVLFFAIISVVFNIIQQIGFQNLVGDNPEQIIMQNWDKIWPVLGAVLPYIIIMVVLLILAAYVIPMAIMNYIANDRLGKAFAFGEVFRKAFNGKYFVAWILAMVISAIVGLVLGFIPWIGGPAGSFIGGVISYTILGQVYREIRR